jgi:pyruvate,water dikinase
MEMSTQPSVTSLSSGVTSSEILPFTSVEATLALAGGKGANLAALTRAGFDVPPGFIVTTDLYHAFVSANQIGPRLLDLASASSPDAPATLDAASEEIRALFNGGTMPDEITVSIRTAYDALPSTAGDGDHPPVAVRSSATAEDLPGLSFAGQQDTYLNVVGADALMEAVKACWGSLWTARALAYRARNHIPASDVALAVVVQVMIPSEVSGVLFTANPLTGRRDEMVIDASFGLGEAIVSGQVEPDHYVVDQRALRITSRKLGAKAKAIRPRREGGTEPVSLDASDRQALPDEQILELARAAQRVADHFGAPQDVEWAWAAGKLYLLQSRPITSLYPLPESLLRSDRLRVLFSFNAMQGVVEPLTPLGMAIFPHIMSGILKAAGVRRSGLDVMIPAAGRIYVDVTDLLIDRRLRPVTQTALANIGPGARDAARDLVASGRIPTAQTVSRRRLVRFIFGFRTVFAGVLATMLRPAARRAGLTRKADGYVAQVRQALENGKSLQTCLFVIDRKIPQLLRQVLFTIAPALIPGVASQGIVDRWLVEWGGAEPGTARRLVRGLPGNVTTEMDLRLWATAQAIRSDKAATAALLSQPADTIARDYQAGLLPATAQNAIKAFLDEYGMRAVGEIDIGRPRWREDPRSIIQTLSSYLQIGDPDLGPDRVFERAAAEAEKLAAQYIAQVRQKGGPLRGTWRAHLLGALIRRMRLLGGVREMPKFYIIKTLDLLRTALLDCGRDLAAQGKLEHAEDIFFLPLDTLHAVARGEPVDLMAIVHRQWVDYDRELTRRQIPLLVLSTGEAFYQSASGAGANDLVGIGVSPGTVEGKVRIVLDPRGVRLEPGEILVCPATDPGWTPLFLSAGGLVMELGGMVTHGSVIAREYGIPAVIGVREATQRLRTGQKVRVDGSAGRVTVLEKQA